MKKLIFPIILFMAVGFALRINNLSGRSLWTDEFFTLFQSSGHGLDIKAFLEKLSVKPELLKAREFRKYMEFDSHKSIKDVSSGLFATDTHPPLYFWLMYFWRRIFLNSVFALRFFSVLMGVISIFMAYRVGRRLFNATAAGFCALFVSICAFNVRYSQEARAYSLVIALGLLAWLFILRLEKSGKSPDALCFAFFNALGFYTHYFYIFISVAEFIYFTAAHHKDSAKLNKFYLAFLLSVLSFSPWYIPLILKGYNFYLAEWIFGYPGIIDKIIYLFSGVARYVVIFDVTNLASGIFLSAGLLLFVFLALSALKDMAKRYTRQFLFCLVMIFVPLSGMLFIDILQHGFLLKQERFWVFPFLGFIPLAGYSLAYGFSRVKIAVAALLLIMLVSCITVTKIQFGPAPLYASMWINQESGGRESAVITYNIRSVIFAQSYYLDDNIYLLPVSDKKQLDSVLKTVCANLDRLFIVRHYHRSDASLMNQPFMETADIDSGFKFKGGIYKNDISVSEFAK